jgi:hypothetical protein
MKGRAYNRYALNIGRPHLVLLGAGASLAAFPNGEKNGLKLPLMNNFVETVNGLSDYLGECGIDYKGQNFEDLYNSLYEDSQYDEIRQVIEEIIYDYFAQMGLPDEPTLYDHLVLSLTARDVVATFNWDPFLWQAMCRNYHRVGNANLPHPFYLHGNTAVGVCTKHEKIQISHKDTMCSKCRRLLSRSKLLYPIGKKDYNIDPFIKSSWDGVKSCLKSAYMFTIFGYGAPSSDVEAVGLLSEAWGDKYQRSMEQIELIDKIEENAICERWEKFIHTHHYDYHNDFYSSMIAKCSRRSVDASFGANYNCIAWEEYPIPKDASWDELDEWLKPYIEVENKPRLRGND